MPLIYKSSYSKRPLLLFNSYLETLYPYFTAKVRQVTYAREQLELADGDFLDLDWIQKGAKHLVLFSHGFEGNSKDHFVEKTAAFLSDQGYDILVWHYRSCGGTLNRLPRFYHHGDVEDLSAVVNHAVAKKKYQRIALVGFSMGGNLVINYLGSQPINKWVTSGIALSTPLDLEQASQKLMSGFNRLLAASFFKKLKKKVHQKKTLFPALCDSETLQQITDLEELHERILLPLSGFKSIKEYYDAWSSLQFLEKIRVPFLLLNAKNDPLLSKNCYPTEICRKHEMIFLETPKYGGHMGFSKKVAGEWWYPQRIHSFIENESMHFLKESAVG